MKQIGTIKINNIEYTINWADKEDLHGVDVNFGFVDYQQNAIAINMKLSKSSRDVTIKHEVTHAYLDAYGFCGKGNFTDEELCDIVARYALNIIETSAIVSKIYDTTIKEKIPLQKSY